jgi:hypothetical protein
MRRKISVSFLVIAITHSAAFVLAGMAAPVAAAPGGAAVPPTSFQLPPAPTPTASPAPQVQGPVDIEGPVPVAPRVIPTARPAPVPTPSAAQRPLPTILQPEEARAPQTRRFTPAARATPGQRVSGEDLLPSEVASGSPLDLTPAEPALDRLPSPTSLPDLVDSGANQPNPGATGSGNWMPGWTTWIALAIGLLALIGGAFAVRSRRQMAPAGSAPIEPPLARRRDPQAGTAAGSTPTGDTSPVPAQPSAPKPLNPAGPITLAISPLKLSRSLMNATLSCSITLHNSSMQAFENLHISGDLVTAHGKVPISEQLASGATILAPLKTMDALPGGETGEVSASFILPVDQIRTINQGRATLYVPLLRLMITGEGLDPVTQTFVIGMKPSGSDKVQPFRLDEMPQTYDQIGSRALD